MNNGDYMKHFYVMFESWYSVGYNYTEFLRSVSSYSISNGELSVGDLRQEQRARRRGEAVDKSGAQ